MELPESANPQLLLVRGHQLEADSLSSERDHDGNQVSLVEAVLCCPDVCACTRTTRDPFYDDR